MSDDKHLERTNLLPEELYFNFRDSLSLQNEKIDEIELNKQTLLTRFKNAI